jgi:hypothetical protein
MQIIWESATESGILETNVMAEQVAGTHEIEIRLVDRDFGGSDGKERREGSRWLR